jgi:type III secretion protein J
VLDDPNAHLITRIKRLVESSVTGLQYDNVSVIADRARYTEIPLSGRRVDEEKELVSVWTILVAKESVTRFRVFFFSFILLILLLLLTFFWIGWKIYPLMQRYGGFSGLLQLKPLPKEEGKIEDVEGEQEEKGEEKKSDEDDQEGVT